MEDLIKYYSRKDIQKEILKLAKNREISVMYGKDKFGKRPDVLEYENDILELVKNGATSFHASEERWQNPLLLKPGMTKKQLDDLRIGWDFIMDIDTKFLEFSKITTKLIVDALKFHDIKNFSVKFSGGSGFHIGIPFETFPKEVNNQKINLFFPEGIRIIANYIKNVIEEYLREKILNLSSLQEISKALNKPKKDFIKNKQFDPFSVVDIDSILISSRHMFRMPYSINEKTNLVSIPINPEETKNFKLSKAKIKNIKTNITFLDTSEIKYPEATHLLQQAIAFNIETNKKTMQKPKKSQLTMLHKHVITKDFFPPCILKILKGIKEDGRKRSIFILVNFLKYMGWDLEKIQTLLLEWNKKNYEQLREGYIRSQINWHKKQHQTILPPNCSNDMYYRNLAICNPDNWCKKIKNPVNYTNRKLSVLKENKPKKSKKKTI